MSVHEVELGKWPDALLDFTMVHCELNPAAHQEYTANSFCQCHQLECQSQ